MKNSEPNDPLAQWMEGELTDAEVKAQASPAEIERYKVILAAVDNLEPDGDISDIDLNKILETDHENPGSKIVSLTNSRFLFAIAASIALIVGFFTLYQDTGTQLEYTTGIGEKRSIVMPDGKTVIMLAANSTITLDETEWQSKRHISLIGRAYFEVEKGSDFVVSLTDGQQVRVLGTRFDIHYGKGFLNVNCFEGRVETSHNDKSVILNANERLSIVGDASWKKSTENAEKPSWIQGNNQFTNAPLVQVIEALESEYGLSIDYTNIDVNRLFTGYFPPENQELALQLVFEPFGIQYKTSNGKLVLTSNL